MAPTSTTVSGPHYIVGLTRFLMLAAKRRILLLGLVPVMLALIAYIATFSFNPVYQGYASIQLAKVAGGLAQNRNAVSAAINSVTFRYSVVRALGLTLGKEPAADLVFDSLSTPSLRPEDKEPSEVLQMSVRGYSDAEIKKALNVAVRLIADQERPAITTITRGLHDRLGLIGAQLSRLQTEKSLLEKTLAALGASRLNQNEIDEPMASQLRLQMVQTQLSSTNDKINQLEVERAQINEKLTPEQTFATRVEGQLFVSPTPVSPRRVLFSSMVFACSFVGCLLFALMTAPIESLEVRQPAGPDAVMSALRS